jgi:RNA polymerase sigma-70 factor (ECF subfamily)
VGVEPLARDRRASVTGNEGALLQRVANCRAGRATSAAGPTPYSIAAARAEPPDVAALDALVQRYWATLIGRCHLLTLDRQAAADLAQDTWLRVLRARPALDPEGNFPAYLTAVATNLWRDRHRAARRAGPLADERLASLDEPLGTEGGEGDVRAHGVADLDALPLDEQVLLALDVDRALARLDPRARDVLTARVVGGESCAEIGRRYDRTEQTISAWVRQGHSRDATLPRRHPGRCRAHEPVMSRPLPVEVVLRWRLARAAANAPPAPRASHLLELARPPWELWPARWRATVERLRQVQVVYGHAMTAADRRAGGYPVPVVVAGVDGDVEGFAQVLYLSVVEGQLRLRFALDAALMSAGRRSRCCSSQRTAAMGWYPTRRCWSRTRPARWSVSTDSRPSSRPISRERGRRSGSPTPCRSAWCSARSTTG